MRSRHLLSVITLFTLSACSWLHTDPKSAKTFQSKGLDLSCVKTVPNQLQDLFAGNYTSSPEDQAAVQDLFGCIDRALNAFASYTRGSNTDVYAPKELQQFANRYLPENNPLTDGFVSSIFKIKSAVVGGNVNQLTRPEIVVLRSKLTRFGQIIGPFAPYMSALINPGSTSPEIKHIASIALNKFVLNLSSILSDSSNSLSWNDLNAFIKELDVYTAKTDASALTIVREQLPIYQYAKLLLVGGNEGSIEKEKWKPIFDSISHFYDALFLTSNTSELLEQLSIEVESTEEEQARAVAQLTGLFKTLKLDQTLHSRASIEMLSDRFAKVLLLNAALFPRSQGSIALKPFLETPSLRKLSGYIVDQVIHIDFHHIDPLVLQQIGDNVASLIEQASISNSPRTGMSDPLAISKLQDYLTSLEPLFQNSDKTEEIALGISTLRKVLPILLGRDGEALSPKDIRQLIQKSIDLYIIWEKESKKTWTDQVGATLEIVLRYPSLYSISNIQIKAALDDVKKLITKLSPENTIQWDQYQDYINKGLKAKAILFQSNEFTLTNYELNQLSFLYEPFRKGDDLGTALFSLANLLQVKSFQNVNISDLIPMIDSFLPENQGLSARGLTPTILSDVKAILIGGNPKVISKNEFTDLARTFGVFYTALNAKLKSLPAGYEPGINSNTFDILGTALKALMDSRKSPIAVNELKTLALDMTKDAGYTVKGTTLDKILAGLTTRVFHQSIGPKPKTLNGLFVVPSELESLATLCDRISLEMGEIELAYRGLNPKQDTISRFDLLKAIKNQDLQTIITAIQPILEGNKGGLKFPKKGEINDRFYQFDLLYKAFIYNTLQLVYPLYKITDDSEKPGSSRINEADMTDLLYDIDDLIEDLKLAYPDGTTAEHAAKSRMRSINLFTHTGNGDQYVDAIETTEFLTITYGGKKILSEVSKTVFETCAPETPDTDLVKEIPINCLSKTFFNKDFMSRIYGDVIPQLIGHYQEWDADGIEVFRKATLTSTIPNWTEDGSLPHGELETLVSIPYYIENLFERFDTNQDDYLQFSEAMGGFPIFCREIQKVGGSSLKGSCLKGQDPGQIEAVYGYLLFRGQAPRGIRKTDSLWQQIKAAKDILSWFNFWKRLDKTPSVRDQYPPKIDRKDLLKIMANLSGSTSETPSLVPEDAPAVR